jgi:pyruvate formate lyase activating enzyme
MNKLGLIFDIQRYSIHDGPGIRTLIFMKGCPLRCLWCDNPEGQMPYPEILFSNKLCIKCWKCTKICPVGSIKEEGGVIKIDRTTCTSCGKCAEICYAEAIKLVGQWMSVEDVLKVIERDYAFYKTSGGGVTLGGGEPTMQSDFASLLLKACKERGINTAIETCGYTKWENFEKMLKHLDLVYYDIKHMDSKIHEYLTGKPNELILENLRKLSQTNLPIIIRVPLIPGCNDQEVNIRRTAEFVSTLGNSIMRVEILPYHRLGMHKYEQLGREYKLKNLLPPSKEAINNAAKIFEAYGLTVQIGG